MGEVDVSLLTKHRVETFRKQMKKSSFSITYSSSHLLHSALVSHGYFVFELNKKGLPNKTRNYLTIKASLLLNF